MTTLQDPGKEIGRTIRDSLTKKIELMFNNESMLICPLVYREVECGVAIAIGPILQAAIISEI